MGGEEPEKKSGCLKYAAIGCLSIVILGVIGGWFAYRKVKDMAWNYAGQAASEMAGPMVTEFGFTPEEAETISEAIERLADEGRERRLGPKDAAQIGFYLFEDPASMALMMHLVDNKYLEPSTLDDAEKAEARMTMARFARTGGVITLAGKETAPPDPLVAILLENPEEITKEMQAGEFSESQTEPEFKETLTDDEIREAMQIMKQRADAASIPDSVETMDLGAEIDRAIDEALGKL